MKWIKIVIGFVIAIAVIPMIVLNVIDTTKSLGFEEITITIEINYNYDDDDMYYYDFVNVPLFEMNDYIENGFVITNLYDYTNNINITITNFTVEGNGLMTLIDNNSIVYGTFFNTLYFNKTYDDIYSVTADNLQLLDLTFTKGNPTIITTLLSFAPLVFIGGVLLFLYKPFKKED